MSIRNEDFPFMSDLIIGDTWMSEILQQFNEPVERQIVMLNQYLAICHAYYSQYLDMHQGLFLNNHDLDNLCHLFNNVHHWSTTIIGREFIFFYYNRVVSDYGHVEIIEDQRTWLLETMTHLRLTPSIQLPTNHRYHQARSTIPNSSSS